MRTDGIGGAGALPPEWLGSSPSIDTFDAAREPSAPIDLAQVWDDLIRGRQTVERSFHTETRCYLVLRQPWTLHAAHRELGDRDLRILNAWLTHGSQKRTALEFQVAPSTITGALHRCLSGMGLSCGPSYVPPLLVMAANSRRGSLGVASARECEPYGAGARYRMVSTTRPEQAIASVLTHAERDVVRLLIDGHSRQQIARLRASSPRTIANHLARIFQKLHVSGRVELAIHMVQRLLAPDRQAAQ